ncbi:MAG: hypothetical protein A2Z95_01185 [Gallionellales bacterium GWA2_60_18]|nr:MAG: hypothetical protein A2Z95_01185 [Gallionellales bacterium GWA2_60_18]
MKTASQATIRKPVACSLLFVSLMATGIAIAAEQPAPAPATQPDASSRHDENAVYATVNGHVILIRDYVNAFNAALRQKFYHGKVPEGKMSELRQDILDQMTDRILLIEEAKRRGLTPDENKIAETIAGYETQYAASPVWQQNRERLLPGLRTQIGEQNLLEQLEKSVRTTSDLSEREARRFYNAHQELFTEPEKLHLSAIMLSVDPSSPRSIWDQTLAEAQAIHERLKNGADFAETARLHSNGKEAEQGGDLGYVHRGMLPEALQQKVDDFKVGVISEPIALLEGIAIFRLEDRRPARLRAFADVAERARNLAQRERTDAAWSKLKTRLKSAAKIKILANLAQPGANAGRP